jgi:hypothetical protein
VFGT